MKEIFYDWFGLNAWLFKLINGLSGNAAYDRLMRFITGFGNHENFKYFFVLVALALVGHMAWERLRGKAVGRAEVRAALSLLITLVMAYIACGLAARLLKEFFAFPRPFMLPDIRTAMHLGVPYPPVTEYYTSFPSGHAITIALAVMSLRSYIHKRAVYVAAGAAVFLVCWSRIALGMHFPADVLAGALIGVAVTWCVHNYVYRMMSAVMPDKRKR